MTNVSKSGKIAPEKAAARDAARVNGKFGPQPREEVQAELTSPHIPAPVFTADQFESDGNMSDEEAAEFANSYVELLTGRPATRSVSGEPAWGQGLQTDELYRGLWTLIGPSVATDPNFPKTAEEFWGVYASGPFARGSLIELVRDEAVARDNACRSTQSIRAALAEQDIFFDAAQRHQEKVLDEELAAISPILASADPVVIDELCRLDPTLSHIEVVLVRG